MKLLRSLAIAATLAGGVSVSLADEAKPTPKKEEVKEANPEDVKKFLAFFDQVVEVVVKNDKKCDQMATDLDSLFTNNAALIKMANEAKAKGQKLPKDAQDHMVAGVKKMAPAMQGCMKNEKVKAAFAKFDGKDGKKK